MSDYYDALNRDGIARLDFAGLIARTRSIVETGTFHGVTTEFLASFGLPVHTIESVPDYYHKAKELVGHLPNVTCHLGDSPLILDKILPTMPRPVFLFLDAHWYDACPLLDELAAIASHCAGETIIAIHDFKVPDKDFGYDSYHGRDYDLPYIRDLLPAVFPDGYDMRYNDKAEGARRGIIYLSARGLTALDGAGTGDQPGE